MTTTSLVVTREAGRPDSLARFHAGAVAPSVSKIIGSGEVIYRRGDKTDTIYKIERGAVRIYRISYDGCRQIFAFHDANEWFGLEAGAYHENHAEALCQTHLQAVTKSRAAFFSSANLLDISLHNLTLAYERQALIVRPTAVARVAGFLEDIARRSSVPDDFELAMSRVDIADYLGLTVESVARAFTKLSCLRVIRIEGRLGRHVHVLSSRRLAAGGF